MRFTIQNLCWLMLAVAVASFVARPLQADVLVILLAWLGVAYVTAPLLLALASSFFQIIPSRKRAIAGYYLLLVLGGIPALLLGVLWPGIAVIFAGLTCTLWIIQIEIFSKIHENQE